MVGWPWLQARTPPSHPITPLLSRTRGGRGISWNKPHGSRGRQFNKTKAKVMKRSKGKYKICSLCPMSRPYSATSWQQGFSTLAPEDKHCNKEHPPLPSASCSNPSSSITNQVLSKLLYHSPKLAPHLGLYKLNKESGHIHLNLHFLKQTHLIWSIRLHCYSVSLSGSSHTSILANKQVLPKDLRSLIENASSYRLKSFSTAKSRAVLHLFLKEKTINIFLS